MLENVVSFKALLEEFVVAKELVLNLGFPVYFRELHCAWVEGVNHLAVDGSCGTLLYLLETQLHQVR